MLFILIQMLLITDHPQFQSTLYVRWNLTGIVGLAWPLCPDQGSEKEFSSAPPPQVSCVSTLLFILSNYYFLYVLSYTRNKMQIRCILFRLRVLKQKTKQNFDKTKVQTHAKSISLFRWRLRVYYHLIRV